MHSATVNPSEALAATLAKLDAAAAHYSAEIDRLTAEAKAAKEAGDLETLADIREDRDRAVSLFNFACDRAATLRASR